MLPLRTGHAASRFGILRSAYNVRKEIMFDLLYVYNNPLVRSIFVRCAELSERINQLPPKSLARKTLEKRLSRLEQYRLPKPTHEERNTNEPILNKDGQQIGTRHSMRRRTIAIRRGRPEEFTIQTRAALEEKLANPTLTWRHLAQKFRFSDDRTLERSVRRLKTILKSERIPLPRSSNSRK
jgi:hypothetical protein